MSSQYITFINSKYLKTVTQVMQRGDMQTFQNSTTANGKTLTGPEQAKFPCCALNQSGLEQTAFNMDWFTYLFM